ncbi:MAG TPA: prepilin-type cleavage/methylation domain-containing protein, partial [Gammaproteobacteria bacterium]|nr:prepilin-type cleavage/methylation domain-containing protein [Gammaproteobacteria bacterium]
SPGNASVGLPATIASINGNAVTSVEVNGSVITIKYNKKVTANATILMSATSPAGGGTIIWSCTGGSVLAKYRPSNCRK